MWSKFLSKTGISAEALHSTILERGRRHRRDFGNGHNYGVGIGRSNNEAAGSHIHIVLRLFRIHSFSNSIPRFFPFTLFSQLCSVNKKNASITTKFPMNYAVLVQKSLRVLRSDEALDSFSVPLRTRSS
jgi:hypothetical protein